jgi:hypothetical protein
MVEVVIVIISILAALTIILYATWLLFYRLKSGYAKSKSFGEWLRNIFEAIWGL